MRRGGGLHRVPVKSKASRRCLKLPDELVVQLRRTTCATLLLQAGMADLVSRSLGHTDVRMTARYAHIVDPTRQTVADTMLAVLWTGAK
jgi:integrase